MSTAPPASVVSLPSIPPAVLTEHDQAMVRAREEGELIRLGDSASDVAVGGSSIGSWPIQPSSVSNRPMRINALDAASLDNELGSMLQHSLRRCFKYLPSLSERRLELELVLNTLIFGGTIWADIPTPGMKLQNVQLQNYQPIAAAAASTTGSITRNLISWLTRFGGRWKGMSGTTTATTSANLDSLRSLLPSTSLAGLPSDSSTIALSNFESIAAATAGGTMTGLASDAASSTVATSVTAAPAVLLSPLPTSAPVLLSLRQKLLYFGGAVLLRYVWSRLTHQMTMDGWGGAEEGSWQKWMYKVTRRMEQAYQAASMINFILFLKNGCYRSLLERLLSIRLLYLRPHLGRSLSFEFMNQQIAWSALSEFMLFLLPLINFGWIQDGWKWISTSLLGSATNSDPSLVRGCPVCHSDPPIQPHRAEPCGHIFCYYCLAGNRLAAQQQQRGSQATIAQTYQCPACETPINNQQRT